MGRDKATLEVDGLAMAVRVARALRAAGAVEVVAIGGDAQALERLGLTVRPDDEPGGGPLGGTRTAVRTASQPVVAVLACDLLAPSPAAVEATVAALLARPDAVGAVPVADGHHQWTHAVWRSDAARDALDAAWQEGARSLRRAAARLAIVEVHGLDPVALADADTPGDLR
jgi:molybdopterin-guanine dinucleotide biosynthesis protein A